jgi:hypothetical protein
VHKGAPTWEGPRKARASEPTDARPQNPTTGGSTQIRRLASAGSWIGAALVIVALLVPASAGAHTNMTPGHIRGIVTANTKAGRALRARLQNRGPLGIGSPGTSSNLQYNGGPVMHSDANYAIYWKPSGYPRARRTRPSSTATSATWLRPAEPPPTTIRSPRSTTTARARSPTARPAVAQRRTPIRIHRVAACRPAWARASVIRSSRPRSRALGGSPGAEYNEQISSGDYYLQEEWSNASSGCAQRM